MRIFDSVAGQTVLLDTRAPPCGGEGTYKVLPALA